MYADGRETARNRGEHEHQTNHDGGEVGREDDVEDCKEVRVGEMLEAEVHADRDKEDETVKVEEESGPGRGLMLRHGLDDRDVGGSAKQGEQTRGEERHATHGSSEDDHTNERDDGHDEPAEEYLDMARVNDGAEPVDEHVRLQQAEDAHGREVLGRGQRDGLEANELDGHGHECAEDVESAVGHVETATEAARYDEREYVHGDDVDDENVATPRGHHVEVSDGGGGTPDQRARVEGAKPQEEAEHEGKDRDGLVIVRACD